MDQRTSSASSVPAACRPSPLADSLAFFREFLRNPAAVGSVIPTSQPAIEAMLSPVDWTHCKLFVEYGPGMGTFTRPILERLAPDAMLIAIDPNPRFTGHLAETIADPRLRAVTGSAVDVERIIADQGHDHADYVLSGLPFSTLPEGLGPAIAAATHRALRPGGAFLIYQYSLFVLPLLRPHFHRIDIGRVWRNIPPARTVFAWKDADG